MTSKWNKRSRHHQIHRRHNVWQVVLQMRCLWQKRVATLMVVLDRRRRVVVLSHRCRRVLWNASDNRCCDALMICGDACVAMSDGRYRRKSAHRCSTLCFCCYHGRGRGRGHDLYHDYGPDRGHGCHLCPRRCRSNYASAAVFLVVNLRSGHPSF